MRKLFIFLFLSVFCMAYAQEEHIDGTFVAHMMNTDAEDLKCDIRQGNITESDIQELMDNGRYVLSVTHTKFGTIILHKKNTDSVEQCFAKIPAWNLKKESKKWQKKGFVLDYYNDEQEYAVLKKDPKITEQKFFGSMNNKKLKKLNKKGFYVFAASFATYYAQNGHDDIVEQNMVYCRDNKKMYDDFKKMAADSWVVGSVSKFYNRFGNSTSYHVIYNKMRNGYDGMQAISCSDTKEDLAEFLKPRVKEGYNISRIWCGWENRDYAALDARVAAAYDDEYNVFDILTGLTTSVVNLATGNVGTTSVPSSGGEATTSSGSTANGSSGKTTAGKCRRCGGSGKCSPTSGGGRKNACHGSGLCGYCNGTGWIKAGASETKCNACNGKGKCKTCNGTGKCPVCHGTGH